MKTVILLALLVTAGWYGYGHYQRRTQFMSEVPRALVAAPPRSSARESPFKCDGRTACSQMKSCAEATFFLQNCPNTTMDGNNDGVPCERQWCR